MNGMRRHRFLKMSGALGAGLAFQPLVRPVAAQTGAKSVRPNILVFLTDDHGQWAQHAYGNAELEQFFAKYTVPGHRGLDLERQPQCTPASPWPAAK
ncbi:MAG: hypothetical protein ABSG04_07535 [Verrucomicrobiota bacterium]|jgi:hypothetical protein